LIRSSHRFGALALRSPGNAHPQSAGAPPGIQTPGVRCSQASQGRLRVAAAAPSWVDIRRYHDAVSPPDDSRAVGAPASPNSSARIPAGFAWSIESGPHNIPTVFDDLADRGNVRPSRVQRVAASVVDVFQKIFIVRVGVRIAHRTQHYVAIACKNRNLVGLRARGLPGFPWTSSSQESFAATPIPAATATNTAGPAQGERCPTPGIQNLRQASEYASSKSSRVHCDSGANWVACLGSWTACALICDDFQGLIRGRFAASPPIHRHQRNNRRRFVQLAGVRYSGSFAHCAAPYSADANLCLQTSVRFACSRLTRRRPACLSEGSAPKRATTGHVQFDHVFAGLLTLTAATGAQALDHSQAGRDVPVAEGPASSPLLARP